MRDNGSLTWSSDYLKQLNLYRQRVWMCKVTGKTGLTYEEALVSEQLATEKVQQFPKELMTVALSIIQYSKSYSLLSSVMKKYMLIQLCIYIYIYIYIYFFFFFFPLCISADISFCSAHEYF